MAVNLSITADTFLHKVLSTENLNKYIQLQHNGIEFSISLYSVKAVHPGGPPTGWQVILPVGTSTLMKAVGSPPEIAGAAHAMSMVNEFMSKLHGVIKPGASVDAPTIKPTAAEYQSLGKILKAKLDKDMLNQMIPEHEAEDKIDAAATSKYVPSHVAKAKGKPGPKSKTVDGVINLRHATAVGQKVHGTSGGSVYITIAVNPRVKVAARVVKNGLSIRVETDNATAKELQAVQSVVQWKGEYGSVHLDIGAVPARRVLGAALFGMGVQFDEMITPDQEVPGGI